MTVCPDGILLVAEHAAKENKLFSLNLSAPFISTIFTERLDKTLPYVDLLFGNEQEVEAYASAHKWDTTDIVEIAKRLSTIEKVRICYFVDKQNCRSTIKDHVLSLLLKVRIL